MHTWNRKTLLWRQFLDETAKCVENNINTTDSRRNNWQNFIKFGLLFPHTTLAKIKNVSYKYLAVFAKKNCVKFQFFLNAPFMWNCPIAFPLSIGHGEKKLEFSGFFIMSSFVLCDTLSDYLERPNNSDSNISHCCHWRHVYILVALVCNSCAELTELILNVQKYSDKWLWSQLKIIHPYCFSITY